MRSHITESSSCPAPAHPHRADPQTLCAHDEDNFQSLISTAQDKHAVLFQRPHYHRSYLDIFNNAGGIRDELEDVIFSVPDGDVNHIYARCYPNGFVSYNNGEDDITHKVNTTLSKIPYLKLDFELAIKLITDGHDERIVQVGCLSHRPNINEEYYHPEGHAVMWHQDRGDTVYIQVGGAGLECYAGTNTPALHPTCLQGDTSSYFDAASIPQNMTYALESSDMMYFRGAASGFPLIHRRPAVETVNHIGRLAFNFFHYE